MLGLRLFQCIIQVAAGFEPSRSRWSQLCHNHQPLRHSFLTSLFLIIQKKFGERLHRKAFSWCNYKWRLHSFFLSLSVSFSTSLSLSHTLSHLHTHLHALSLSLYLSRLRPGEWFSNPCPWSYFSSPAKKIPGNNLFAERVKSFRLMINVGKHRARNRSWGAFKKNGAGTGSGSRPGLNFRLAQC